MSYDQCCAEHGRLSMRCGLPEGHRGMHEDCWGKKFVADVQRRAPGQGQEPTGAKAAQINAAPEVGAPTGAVEGLDLLALLGDVVASARRCGRAEIHGGDNLLRWDKELAENYRALTHALAEIRKAPTLNNDATPTKANQTDGTS